MRGSKACELFVKILVTLLQVRRHLVPATHTVEMCQDGVPIFLRKFVHLRHVMRINKTYTVKTDA